MSEYNSYENGFVQRVGEGKYEGDIRIEGVSLSPICASTFTEGGNNYLWLRRKDILEYDSEQQRYIARKREPRWEAYLEKQLTASSVSYKGEFYFMHTKFSIVGIWDSVLGMDKQRMNFFVERLPRDKQDIINKINERNINNGKR